jgi:hypothetical protein
MIAVQDGFAPWHIARFLGPGVGIFVGGSTEWKLATMAEWSRLAHTFGAKCHVGRVNTGRRVKLCDIAGVDSFDGSGPSRFLNCLPPILDALEQPDFEGWLARHDETRHVIARGVEQSGSSLGS